MNGSYVGVYIVYSISFFKMLKKDKAPTLFVILFSFVPALLNREELILEKNLFR